MKITDVITMLDQYEVQAQRGVKRTANDDEKENFNQKIIKNLKDSLLSIKLSGKYIDVTEIIFPDFNIIEDIAQTPEQEPLSSPILLLDEGLNEILKMITKLDEYNIKILYQNDMLTEKIYYQIAKLNEPLSFEHLWAIIHLQEIYHDMLMSEGDKVDSNTRHENYYVDYLDFVNNYVDLVLHIYSLNAENISIIKNHPEPMDLMYIDYILYTMQALNQENFNVVSNKKDFNKEVERGERWVRDSDASYYRWTIIDLQRKFNYFNIKSNFTIEELSALFNKLIDRIKYSGDLCSELMHAGLEYDLQLEDLQNFVFNEPISVFIGLLYDTTCEIFMNVRVNPAILSFLNYLLELNGFDPFSELDQLNHEKDFACPFEKKSQFLAIITLIGGLNETQLDYYHKHLHWALFYAGNGEYNEASEIMDQMLLSRKLEINDHSPTMFDFNEEDTPEDCELERKKYAVYEALKPELEKDIAIEAEKLLFSCLEKLTQEPVSKRLEIYLAIINASLYNPELFMKIRNSGHNIIAPFFLFHEELTEEDRKKYIDTLIDFAAQGKENYSIQNLISAILIEIIKNHAADIENDLRSYFQIYDILVTHMPARLEFDNREQIFYEMFNISQLVLEKLRSDTQFLKIAAQHIFFALGQLNENVFKQNSLQSMLDESGQTCRLIVSAFMDSISLRETAEINTAEKMIDTLKAHLPLELARQVGQEIFSCCATFNLQQSNINKFLEILSEAIYGDPRILAFPVKSENNIPQTVSPVRDTLVESQTEATTSLFCHP